MREYAASRVSRLSALTVVEATVAAAVQASRDASARAVIVLAVTGVTASLLAKYKCGSPIVVVTAHDHVARYCQAMIPGAYVLHVPNLTHYGYADADGDDEFKMVAEGTRFACALGLVCHGDDILCAVHSYRVARAKNIAMRFFHANTALEAPAPSSPKAGEAK